MTTNSPQDVQAYLTPQQIEAMRERYKAKEAGDALAAVLLFMAGAFVIAELAGEARKPRKRKRA